MKNRIIIIVFIFVLAGCWFLWNNIELGKQGKQGKSGKENAIVQEDHRYRDADIKAVIIPAEGNTFGYDIYVYGSVMVHQPSRPGPPGNAGFATEEDARKVAELVIQKIRNNELPPTVTIEELRELEVL